MTDIKQTLATAFTDEPPLTIDKPAIRRAGKRKVATRYASIGAAVLVAVVVVAVPTMVNLGGGGGGPDVGQVSAPESQTSIPRTTVVISETKPLDPGLSDERAVQLTGILRDSGAIPAMQTHSPPGSEFGPWEFEAWGSFYRTHAEVFDARGSAIVSMSLVARPYEGCEEITFQSANRTCEVRTTADGREYKVELGPDVPGNLIRVTLKLPDGRKLEVSTQGIEDRSKGPYNTTPVVGGGPQPLTVDEVVKLATVPGLTF
ncbi:hypothetical protein ALI22I_40365 [Saccharothrix sp. ALI-22-I]|uniref:hypothetical protein n=1 Tax=Saccharothrix sp. ALI-22-I TaxID=1933778 RepID=UPI00097C50EA|nr:hypothetical protein [Saccharothrix sp. ALI-22-I]ONI82363.1 hypothetical protein ALI22I_40365 [Saccharothrix sp. ALI-22-I]